MKTYWSCSAFANWIRGTDKLHCGTSKEWKLWKKDAKQAHPFRFWLAEEGLDYLESLWCYVPEKINNVRYYLNNRFVVRTHALTAHPRDIARGGWCDVGNRFLPCLFNELVNFVEVEKAWMMVCWGDKETREKYELPYWRKQWYTRWFMEWRCPQAGLAHLDWEIGLTWTEDEVGADSSAVGVPTPQAIKAKELKALYEWWTVERPKRADPYDASGWSALCDEKRKDGDDIFDLLDHDDRTPEEEAKTRSSLDTLHKLEEQYENEDEEMMIRLIKVRHGLWT